MLDHAYQRRPLRVVQPCSSIQRSDSDSSAEGDIKSKRWPPRTVASLRNKRFLQEHHTRPQTATLAKPRVLDTCYLTKVDMSLTRKALLNISNLCKSTGKRGGRVPMKAFAKITTSGVCMQLRPNHRPVGRSLSEADESWEDEDSCSEMIGGRSVSRTKTFIRESNVNNQGSKSGAKLPAAAKKGTKRTVPEPCHSCGRSDLPERLHSHPATKSRTNCRSQTVPAVTVTRPVKSSVQRPTPIKYKSAVNSKKLVENSHQTKGKPEVRSILKSVFPKPPASPNLGPRPPRSPTKLLAPTSVPSPKGRSKSPNKQVSKAPLSPKVHALPVSSKPNDKPPASPLPKQNKSPSPKPIHKLSPNIKKKDVSPTRATSPRSFVVVEDKAEKKKPVSPKKVEAKPGKVKLLPCYVCGKDFAPSLLPLHEPKCLEVR
jgi:zinc-finger of a C2HC-type